MLLSKKKKQLVLCSVISLITLTLLYSATYNNDDTLITKNSIGSVAICDNVDEIDLPYISDSTFSGDGFYFLGKFFGTNQATILVGLSQTINPKIVYKIITKSPVYKTIQGISVNSSLSELVKVVPDIKFTTVVAGYEDLYFLQKFDSSRIEFRFDRSTELEIYKLNFSDRNYGIDDVEGMRELVNRIGHSARIREITVVKTRVCKK